MQTIRNTTLSLIWRVHSGYELPTVQEQLKVIMCLRRHPSNCTEYWLYYETRGIFHRQPFYIFTDPFIRICCNHKRTVYRAVVPVWIHQRLLFVLFFLIQNWSIFCNRVAPNHPSSYFLTCWIGYWRVWVFALIRYHIINYKHKILQLQHCPKHLL